MAFRGCPVLGIDIGTTNTKVALVEIGASGLAVRQVAAGATPPPTALGGTLHTLIGRATEGGPVPQAVGIASMAETGVPLDAAGEPLGGWLRWDGQRGTREADELARRLGWTALVAATGTRPSAKVPLATWAWLRAQEPGRFAAMARWAGAADLAGKLLTGRLATDHTLAGRTMAYRLPRQGGALPAGFDPDLLAEVGLRPDALPDVVPTDAIGRADGIGAPVVIAGHDHAVGAYACGVRQPGQVADSVGTAEAVLSVVAPASAPDPVEVARAGMSSVVTVDGRSRALLAGAPTAGALVEWWRAHEDPDPPFAAAAALGDEPIGPVVLPYLRGRQAPDPDPAAELRVVGRRPEHTPAQLARALLDGLCLQARWLLDEQQRLAGADHPPPSVVALGGPLAANPAWLRVKALTGPSPLRFVAEAEPVAAGAALIAAVRVGLVDPADAALRGDPVDAAPHPGYEAALRRFVAAAIGGDTT